MMQALTPKAIVAALDEHIIGQRDAKREKALLLGVPQKFVRDKRATATVREAKNEAAQASQQQQIEQQGQLATQDAMAKRMATAT